MTPSSSAACSTRSRSVITIVISLAIIVPTAYGSGSRFPGCGRRRVRHPHAVRDPADHPVFGLIRIYSSRPAS
jgi:hypothetical protein